MDKNALKAVATSVRTLSMDAIQKANSGHPGLPMGMAELGAILYGEVLKHYPKDPGWANRDRFVLSAGHGSMLLYSLLHLSGYELTLDDIRKFRQVGSSTPGHPEYGYTPGVETTTGPLGQGVGNAVGMAIAEEYLAATFNTERKIVDHYTYALAGDGCMMEGVTSEVSSLAGHLKLGKLILFYDSNGITIEGKTSLAFTEDVLDRYDSYGWQTLEGDAYDLDGISRLIEEAKRETSKPTLILLHSTIGKGSPNKAGSHTVHGAPLGDEEILASRKNIGTPEGEDFYIAPVAQEYFAGKQESWHQKYEEWNREFGIWAKENHELKSLWDRFHNGDIKIDDLPEFKEGEALATRSASGKVLLSIAEQLPNFIGGSADLSPSNNTTMPDYGDFGPHNRKGRTLHYGVREHGMGAVANGIHLHGGLRTFTATFLVFCDYMRYSIRLAAMMKLPIIYVFTHDSIFIGEDGPTHQPVEQIASLRIIPNLLVLRPGDAQETAAAWKIAAERTDGPTALILTRQKLTVYPKQDKDWRKTVIRGAYIVKDSEGTPERVIAATGSEVNLALKALEIKEPGVQKSTRIVSMISLERFLAQDDRFRTEILPSGVPVFAVEAGVGFGWTAITGTRDRILSIDRFGESGPGNEVAELFGFTAKALADML